jgi:hypothetical protein
VENYNFCFVLGLIVIPVGKRSKEKPLQIIHLRKVTGFVGFNFKISRAAVGGQ